MKHKIYSALIVLLIATSCGTLNNLSVIKENAEKASQQKNYSQAVNYWKQYLGQQPTEETDSSLFAEAAYAAFLAGDDEQALSWYDQARFKGFNSEQMYSTLITIYKKQDNLSKELTALEFYSGHYSDNLNEIYSRLFEIYSEIKMNDKALSVWKKMNETSKNEISNQKAYFFTNEKLNNSAVCDSVSQIILDKEPENVDALEWNAKKYYWLGENLYQQEMDKYNKNKTTRQYSILLKQLDQVTAYFKKSLVYFDKLWNLNPGEKYAAFFANIYARFGDKEKADFYKKYIK